MPPHAVEPPYTEHLRKRRFPVRPTDGEHVDRSIRGLSKSKLFRARSHVTDGMAKIERPKLRLESNLPEICQFGKFRPCNM